MEFLGNGVLKGSHMYFYTPSQSAKKLLYYPIAAGEFFCDSNYSVNRENYNSILALYVISGNITLVQNEIEFTARQNEMLIVDCYKPHQYFANGNAHTLWVHFDGANSKIWFDEIVSRFTQKIKCTHRLGEHISSIIKCIKSNANEFDVSNEIYSLLCSISKGNEQKYENSKSDYIETAKRFIISNYTQDLTVEQIAESVNMSVSFFSKLFKESTGFSPYDYLLSVRLDKAKELLQKTDDSVQNIAFKTGFNSTSNFIYFFKKATGLSPLKFRKIEF